MIRVLIVEDEPPSLRRIARLIEQADAGFAVVATASDGEQALERMTDIPCDVVFTDIRMPVMDGLQLMDKLRERYPACIVVVISGYQEYGYLSHALRAQAADYLLKPVAQQDMDALLTRLRGLYEQQRKQLLSRRLSAEINRSELTAAALHPLAAQPGEGFPADAQRLCVCLFCAGAMPYGDSTEMYPGEAAWQSVSPEEVYRAMAGEDAGFEWVFMGNTSVERILIFDMPPQDVDVFVARLLAQMQARTDVPISCAYTGFGIGIQQAGNTIKALRKLAARDMRLGAGLCMPMTRDAQGQAGAAAPRDTALAERLSRLLESAAPGQEASHWRALMDTMEREAWTQRRIHRLFMDALTLMDARRGEAAADIEQMRRNILETMGTALSLDDLAAGLENLSSIAIDAASLVEPSAAQRSVAQEVERYLRGHFAEHISIQMLGAMFGYVPSYISLLFRKEYGISPADYLVRVRLDEAKKLIQQKPGMLIREVAETVGFKSQHHFSRVFKKNEGVWPTQYQECK